MYYGLIRKKEIFIFEAESSISIASYIASLKIQEDEDVIYLGKLGQFYCAQLYMSDFAGKKVHLEPRVSYIYCTFKDDKNNEHFLYLSRSYSISKLNGITTYMFALKHEIDMYNGPRKNSRSLTSIDFYGGSYNLYQSYVVQKIDFKEINPEISLFNVYQDIMNKKAAKQLQLALNQAMEDTIDKFKSMINYIEGEYLK